MGNLKILLSFVLFFFFTDFFVWGIVFSLIWVLILRRILKTAVQTFTHIPACISSLHIFTFWKCSCEQIFSCTTVLKRWIKELRNIIKANTRGARYMNIFAGESQCQQGFSTTYRSALLQIQRYALLQEKLEDLGEFPGWYSSPKKLRDSSSTFCHKK